MIIVWHFNDDVWTEQKIELEPDPMLDEILKTLKGDQEPSFVIFNDNNSMAFFRNAQGKYICSLDMQDVEEIVICHGFPSFLKFVNFMCSTFLAIADMEHAFNNKD